LVAIGWAASAAAQTKVYSLSGSGGYLRGAVPFPIWKPGWPPPPGPPNQAMKAISNARVVQTTGPDPVQMQIAPGQLTKPFGSDYLGVFISIPSLFMVSTNLSAKFPAQAGVGFPPAPGTVTFKAGLRTGPRTLTWCPSYLPTNPPNCTPWGGVIPGLISYKGTKSQFGGPAQASINGKSTRWLKVTSSPPCKHTALAGPDTGCYAIKASVSLPPLVAVGGPFHYVNSVPTAPLPGKIYVVSANTGGTIGLKASVGTASVQISRSSWAGPWTVGQVTIVNPTLHGSTFTITGFDKRVSGVGNISLVAGGLSRGFAHRGYLQLTVGVQKTPALSTWGVASLAFLLAGAARASLARRKK
jgi:hypothetical protein